jgi:hypothetical protein
MQEKMQVDGKQKDKKVTCHLVLVLEQLFRYMFQDKLWVQKRKQ